MSSINSETFTVYPRHHNSASSLQNGYNIHTEYTDIDPSKQTLLLLHGYLGTLQDYSSIISRYSDILNIIACDLRGHGESDAPSEYIAWEIKDFSYDIFQVVSALIPKNQKINIIASSLSTAIALQMAKDFPELIDRLFLISASGNYSMPTLGRLFVNFGKLAPSKLAKILIDFLCIVAPALTFNDVDRKLVKAGIIRFRRIQMDTHKKILNETISSWQIDEEGITHPVLIIAGEKDSVIPFSDSLELNKKLANSSILVLRKTKHQILILRNNTLIEIIDKWLFQSDELLKSSILYEENLFS